MLFHQLSFLASASILTSAVARPIPYRIPLALYRRDDGLPGTLTNSTDPADFGKCPAPLIQGGLGFDGRKEFAFEPEDETAYAHGSADQISIITQFMCDTLVNTCGASVAAHDLCTATQASVGSSKPGGDGVLADVWNLAFGTVSDFANAPGAFGTTGTASGTAAVVTSSAVAAVDQCGQIASSSSEAASTTAVASATATASAVAASSTDVAAGSTSALDFGSCGSPEILFTNNLADRPNAFAFVAADQTDYPHGSALNIGVIAEFIQQRFGSPCNANAAAVAAAASGLAAAQATGGTTQAAANAWNGAFGITA